jgi:hypothetical protein
VNADYSGACDQEFVISSADFGRAYLSDGWATRFMQSLLARFQIVFIGYGADDPPIHYLLEALNLRVGNRSRLFAFQALSKGGEAALWEHRGVRPIPFDDSQGFDVLWDSLASWAQRARDVDGWYAKLLETASVGPAALDPHVRGQVAHVLSTREGARRVSINDKPIPATWLLTFDPRQRFEKPGPVDRHGDSGERIDPYGSLALDFDTPPQPEEDDFSAYPRDRAIPEGSWNCFEPMLFDYDDTIEAGFGAFCGARSNLSGALSTRLNHLGIWFARVAHQPTALWWAADRGPLHPRIIEMIEGQLWQDPERWPDDVRRGWWLLLASWSERRATPDHQYYQLRQRIARDGWSEWHVRTYADLFRPRLKVERRFGVPHPLSWKEGERPDQVLSYSVEYPHPHELINIDDHVLSYAIARFRDNIDLARSLEFEISGSDRIYMQTTTSDDGESPVDFDSFGVTGSIGYYMSLMERLFVVDQGRARAEIASWPDNDYFIYGRLRIWVARKKIISPSESAKIILNLPDDVFWSSRHQREFLYAVRDRWSEFSTEDKGRFEQRLCTTAYPWNDDIPGGKARAEAHFRLDRLQWLKTQGVSFSFDVDAQMSALRAIAKDWSERSGERAADSHAPVVRRVETDANPGELFDIPVGEILERSREVEQSGFFEPVERQPFKGLAEKAPVRAFAALSIAARKSEVPVSFWSTFLHAEKRKTDSNRLVCAIASRLAALPPAGLSSLAYPVSEWLLGLGERLFAERARVLDRLWEPLMASLPLRDDDRKHRVDRSWANDALNAPVGTLTHMLIQDPTSKGREPGQGFPTMWTNRLEQLLALPRDMRRHALVMLGFQINWLFAVAPEWTSAHLLSVVDDSGDDGDALWDGILWAARAPNRTLFERLKPGLLSRALSQKRRRAEANVVGGLLLIGWGGDNEVGQLDQLITNAEMREILVESDDELRGQILWHLEHWSAEEPGGKWYMRQIHFLRDVWPNHRALRTPEMSARLVEFALASRELFPEIVQAILGRLVPVRGGFLRGFMIDSDIENHPAKLYPTSMLELLWTVLAEDAMLWPYKIDDILAILESAPETRGDPRLSELRRRRAA